MMLTVPGWTADTFRDYYIPDQLAYLAIATDWASGSTASVEPFTETGSIYYPRLYYQFLGLVARLTGSTAATAWTVVGLTVQVLLVAMIGTTAVLLTRKAWAGVLAFLPFLVGTLANVRDGGSTWYVQEGFHARLWGTFASIFTLNGDNAAMALGTSALLTLILIVAGRITGRPALVLGLLACGVIGGLSAIQTYSFLTTSYVLAYCAAAYGVHRATQRRLLLGLSLAVALLLYFGGPFLVGVTGPLVLLVLGMAPAIPGVLALWGQTGRIVLFAVVCYAVGAAPQVILTLTGILGGDAFLSFRTRNANDLGVPLWSGLISALPVLVPLLWILAAGVRRRQPLWIAVPSGGMVAWFLAATNDNWGADQEPYRMWINCFGLMVAIALPVGLWVLVETWPGARRPAVVALVSVVALFGAAVPDFLHWRSEVTNSGFVSFSTPQLVAAVAAAEPARSGLVLPGPCIDPLEFKPAYRGPVAYFNRGLAWPDQHSEILTLTYAIERGVYLSGTARAAGVDWLLVDTGCDTPLIVGSSSSTLVDEVPYDGGTVQLWRLNSAGR